MNKLLQIVMTALGIKAFDKDSSGKNILTDEQKASLAKEFGEEFPSALEAQLLNASSGDELTQEQAVDQLKGLIAKAKSPEVSSLQNQLTKAASENANLNEIITALSSQPETDQAAEALKEGLESFAMNFAKDKERTYRIDANASYNVAAADFLKNNGVSSASSSSTIDVADIKKEFGTYLSGGQKMDIYKKIFTGFYTAEYMTIKLAVTEWRATQGIINSVVQQFSPRWTPAGRTKFTAITIKNRRHKINVSIIPDDVVDSWMSYLYSEDLAVDKMPITRYIMQELILPKILEDIELRMIAKGKFDETATDALKEGDSGIAPERGMDGFETILVEAKKVKGTDKDKGINFINSTFSFQNCTDDEILNFVNEFVDKLSPIYRRKDMPVFCSFEFYRRYKRAYKNKWGAGSGTTDPKFGGDRIDFSNSVLTPLESMYGSPILFSTPKENFIILRSKNEVPNIINDIQKVNYEVRIFGEFWLGVGFAIGEAVTAFVPDGYDPYATIEKFYGDSTSDQRYNSSSDDEVEEGA